MLFDLTFKRYKHFKVTARVESMLFFLHIQYQNIVYILLVQYGILTH